jgi:hypothetical protein
VQEILMCHTLPNLLPGDVSGEVDTTSEYPFRKSASCMQCHSAIDPMAGTVRNLMIYTTANDTFSNTELKLGHPAYGVGKIATNLSKTDYVFTPTTGRLFYRDFQNKLVSENVSSLAALGTKVSSSFDFYACAAKRYYYFLTGIDVALNNVPGESELSAYHRKEVFTLATRLKSHQNLMTLIEDILKSDTFQTRNYKSESVGDP